MDSASPASVVATRPGLDHALVCVRDLDAAAAAFAALGFTLTARSEHPWGTVNVLALLQSSLIELIAVGDPSRLDASPVGDFRFGRFVAAALDEREGISLVALHSRDIDEDAARVRRNGAVSTGRVDFRRAAASPEGADDEASVALEILVDRALPRVSHFLCQQRRPEAVWRPQWMAHANGATHVASITYVADATAAVEARLARLYGQDAVVRSAVGVSVETASGVIRVLCRDRARAAFGPFGDLADLDPRPAAVAIGVGVPSLDAVRPILDRGGVRWAPIPWGIAARPAVGNALIVFEAAPPPRAATEWVR